MIKNKSLTTGNIIIIILLVLILASINYTYFNNFDNNKKVCEVKVLNLYSEDNEINNFLKEKEREYYAEKYGDKALELRDEIFKNFE